MTNPQDDVPCRGCETEGPPSRLGRDRLCPDCEIPELRLINDLAAIGVFATRNEDGSVRVADVLTVDVDEHGEWCISGSDHDTDGWTAPEAIAAIVQAPGLRTERDAVQTGIGALWDMLDRAGVRDDVDDRYMQQVSEHCYEPAGEHRRADVLERVMFLVADRDAIAADRDALADRVAALEAHNGRMAGRLTAIADACAYADETGDRSAVWEAVSNVVAVGAGKSLRNVEAALRALAGGAS